MIRSSEFRCSTPPHHAVCSSSSAYFSFSSSAVKPPLIPRYYPSCIIAPHPRQKKFRKHREPAFYSQNEVENEEEEDFQVLSAVQSNYNNILVLDTPKSRLLLLDSSHNVHSILNKDTKWSGSIWDDFATLPPVVPSGPIAIFGLGGGTAAHLMLDLWPSLHLEGWEIDQILIDKSREYFGLHDLEKQNAEGGVLNIHIGDAFSAEAAISGGYAGIIVDLFADGKAPPQLEQADTWLQMHDKLMPEGRLMVNCGAGEKGAPVADAPWKLNATIRALCAAFPGQVNWKKVGENYLAMTGVLPDLDTWSAGVPNEMKCMVNKWETCDIT